MEYLDGWEKNAQSLRPDTQNINKVFHYNKSRERDREEQPDRWKWKKVKYRCESIKAAILHKLSEKKVNGSVGDLGSVI